MCLHFHTKERKRKKRRLRERADCHSLSLSLPWSHGSIIKTDFFSSFLLSSPLFPWHTMIRAYEKSTFYHHRCCCCCSTHRQNLVVIKFNWIRESVLSLPLSLSITIKPVLAAAAAVYDTRRERKARRNWIDRVSVLCMNERSDGWMDMSEKRISCGLQLAF
jgi:hypothetical protein